MRVPPALERMDGIREEWIRYWNRVTGGLSTMTVSPRGGDPVVGY